MTVVEYLDFEIEIGLGQGRDYPLAVLRSPGGEAHAQMLFPFDELALASRLKDLQIALLRSGGQRRQTLSPQERTVQEFGQKLFEALLSGEIRSRYDISQREAARRGLGLRLKLRIQPPELASLPWEFLYDARRAEYLCLSTQTPLVRYLELPQVIQPLLVTPPLRILGLLASPIGLASLDTENEKARVEQALKNLMDSGQVQIAWLEHANRRELQRILRHGPWHILHFIGHGGFDLASDEGFIALETESGELDRLPATQLARLLADHFSLRLAVLNSCEGAQGGNTDVFSSTASVLVRRGLPAVLAMQYEITDRAAIEFARGFYEALADDLPVDAATAEARKAVSLGLTNTIEWGTPVLHMRAPDGVLFKHLSLEELARQALERERQIRLQQGAAERAAQEDAEQAQRFAADKAPQPLPVAAVSKQTTTPAWLKLAPGIILAIVLCGFVFWGVSALVGTLIAAEPTPTKKSPPVTITTLTLTPKITLTAPPPVSPTPSLPEFSVYNPHPANDDIFDAQGVPMRVIPAGTFQMGGDPATALAECQKYRDDCQLDWYQDESPVYTVPLEAFEMDKYEVTNALYQACVEAKACTPPHETKSYTRASYYGDSAFNNYPVIYVDWNQSKAYCKWRGAHLPTEAEWEYAARGGLQSQNYPWGDVFEDGQANFCDTNCSLDWANKDINDGYPDTAPVGSYPPNGYGLYDMAGNVWEWTNDWYDAYPGNTIENSDYGMTYRVVRGGSWYDLPNVLRVSDRNRNTPDVRGIVLGFRCARSSP